MKFTIEVLRRKYNTSYLGKPYFGYFAFRNDRPVAFHGCILFRLKYSDQTELAAQFGSAMTLKEFSGQGLFTRLGEMTEEDLKKEGIRMIFGFPNQNSEFGYINKLGWKFEVRMNGYKVRTRAIPYEKILRRTGFQNLYQRMAESALEKLILKNYVLSNSLENADKVTVLRDENFFRYKNFTSNYILDLNGIKLWVKPCGALHVGDLERITENKLTQLMKDLKLLARRLGLSEIIFQFPEGSENDQLFKKHFQGFSSWIVGYKSLGTNWPLKKLQLCYGDLDTF
jgi:hypothetical protein